MDKVFEKLADAVNTFCKEVLGDSHCRVKLCQAVDCDCDTKSEKSDKHNPFESEGAMTEISDTPTILIDKKI